MKLNILCSFKVAKWSGLVLTVFILMAAAFMSVPAIAPYLQVFAPAINAIGDSISNMADLFWSPVAAAYALVAAIDPASTMPFAITAGAMVLAVQMFGLIGLGAALFMRNFRLGAFCKGAGNLLVTLALLMLGGGLLAMWPAVSTTFTGKLSVIADLVFKQVSFAALVGGVSSVSMLVIDNMNISLKRYNSVALAVFVGGHMLFGAISGLLSLGVTWPFIGAGTIVTIGVWGMGVASVFGCKSERSYGAFTA